MVYTALGVFTRELTAGLARREPSTVITVEDPIESLHLHKKATVHQRELHSDTPAFASALRATLREAPKVILEGEMRTREYLEEGGREGQSLVDAVRNSALDGMQHFDGDRKNSFEVFSPPVSCRPTSL